jgi:hypothetical protein
VKSYIAPKVQDASIDVKPFIADKVTDPLTNLCSHALQQSHHYDDSKLEGNA